ncbi:glycerophosphoryl diester phosphodiesterase membrane domain-containing protein [Paenibacillus eucommiae]|uniref:Glycerophosphoryl diester phosphodiesterase membrane domain-containing protein n=1 Tax=Paenibacillus eucommiae TaxID=1355755 RepID=A0ABS4ITJ4_9BACL|nr:glycerophosphoryl diester phosphodiesterase membrane domain-containing protein [Paenibacillus eucommiae]MBP1990890.1 hypothetical protein [Paenibacillus eucommiae]
MSQMQLRPMGIGRILDRSFQLYRKHFVKLTFLMLLLFGPFYLVQNLILVDQNAAATNSFLEQLRNFSSLEDFVNSGIETELTDDLGLGKILAYIFLLLPIFFLGLVPLAVAAIVFLTRAALLGEETPTIGSLLKSGLRRFWPMAGSTLLMTVIMGAMYIGFMIIILVVALLFAFGAGITGTIAGSNAGVGAAVSAIVLFVLLLLGVLIGFSYFFIRWGYYLPIVATNGDAPALGRSWNLTKRSFWRLFLMYAVLSIVIYIIMFVINLALIAVLGNGLFSQVLQSLLTVLISPLILLPYAVSFFDLKVRNEGMGLEDLIQNTVYGEGKASSGVWQDNPEADQFHYASRFEKTPSAPDASTEAHRSEELLKKDE